MSGMFESSARRGGGYARKPTREQRQAARLRCKAEWIRSRRTELGPCLDCGSDKNLEFDHVDPSTKEHNVSDMASHATYMIEREIRKCQVLCQDCHIKKGRAT